MKISDVLILFPKLTFHGTRLLPEIIRNVKENNAKNSVKSLGDMRI